MLKKIAIGIQDFEKLRTNDLFFIDKTQFIKEWWESYDDVTLITRPRRFGKTLNMSMLTCFFSNKYTDRSDLFDGLSIWNDEKYRKLQGTYPVIYLSFAGVKESNFENAKRGIISSIADAFYEQYQLLDSEKLNESEKKLFQFFESADLQLYSDSIINNEQITRSIHKLCRCLSRYYGKKVLIFLDEYDTPMQEAYTYGYWDEFTTFIRNLFNSTFKTNPYLERAIMTGITRVSKESVFSDLNNLNVVTTTSDEYRTAFGFTEEEVFAALDTYGLSDKKNEVKKWYDGFVFGEQSDIYNPWSIISFLDKRKFNTYWASTSSNQLISRLLQTASVDIKNKMESLLNGDEIIVNFDEQIVFNQLDQNENAIWSLFLASGYVKACEIEYRGDLFVPWYHLRLVNLETLIMFIQMFLQWFDTKDNVYQDFIRALLENNIEYMNIYMNKISAETFSFFDTGKTSSDQTQPEKFYHGFVLGLLASLRTRYQIRSNRESGFGRYDIMMIPESNNDPAIIIEFKVHDPKKEASLEETVQTALNQIYDKKYDTELLAQGISKERIFHYGFAFDGKYVLIASE